jgi:7-cyano-7-deazaguanine synthase
MKTCVVLFSGGLDSTTAIFWAKHHYQNVQALSFQYGQRHSIEIDFSRITAEKLSIPQTVIPLDLSSISGSSLIDRQIQLPEFDDVRDLPSGPPSTYVPFRNGVFLSIAAAWAESRGIQDLVAGFNVIDSPDYPDTRPEFVDAMEAAVNSGTGAAFTGNLFHIQAPFIRKKKSEIILDGLKLGADYSYAISCYSGQEIPCGKCSSCRLRKKAWEESGKRDHLLDRLEKEGKI